jgi:hypothetical protein
VSFERGLFPEFTYEAEGVRLAKRIGMLHGRNAVLIEYRVEEAPRAFTLELRPFVAGRDVHTLRTLEETDLRLRPRQGRCEGGGVFGIPHPFVMRERAIFASLEAVEMLPVLVYAARNVARLTDGRRPLTAYGAFGSAAETGGGRRVLIQYPAQVIHKGLAARGKFAFKLFCAVAFTTGPRF